MSKVIVRIQGGLGNQLFCYAAGRRLAVVNGAELVIDDVTGFTRDHVYQRYYQLDHFQIPCRKARSVERLEPFRRMRRYLQLARNRRRPFQERRYVLQEGIDFDSRLLQVRPRGTVYLEGYWQSENYFKDVEQTIRTDLQITPPADAATLEMAARIRDREAVAVHVRFFDAPDQTDVNNAPGDYYARAVAHMETVVSNGHYFIFSDCPDAVRTRIPLPDDRLTCVAHNRGDENACADLWLMTQCRYFVTANSTFSWWGAWLSNHPDKIVITPTMVSRSGICAWGFKGLLPDEWRQM